MNPRHDGCEITGLYQNRYSEKGTPKQLGGNKNPNIQHLVDITLPWEGDSGNLDRNPVVQTYTNTFFFGATLSGYQEDSRFPNVGEDFSYIFINKAFTFDPDNDEFFITELLGEDDKVFERVVKQDLQYSAKFTVRLLDEGTEHDLKDAYTVHFNAGMFSLLATYSSCSEAPFTQESQLTTQYEAKNLNNQFYYGAQYNPFTTNNPSQNNCPFIFNSNNRVQLTGSFKVETNIDTWWWRRPKSSSFFYGGTGATLGSTMTASGITNLDILSTQGNLRSSVFGFFYRLMSKAHPFADPLENRSYATPPAKKDLHILTFNEAKGCVKQIQTELRYGKNTTQALRHFGSISLSPGRKIPIPGCQLAQPTLSAGGFSINSKIVSPAFEEFVVQTAYGGTSNLTSFHSYYTWFAGGATSGSETAIHSYPASINGSNFGIITGSGNFEFAPKFESFTVSKLVKRTNVIMADINKINDLLFNFIVEISLDSFGIPFVVDVLGLHRVTSTESFELINKYLYLFLPQSSNSIILFLIILYENHLYNTFFNSKFKLLITIGCFEYSKSKLK